MDRVQLKARGKAAFKANYWKTVLVALLMTLIVGGVGGAAGSNIQINDTDTQTVTEYSFEDLTTEYNDINEVPDVLTATTEETGSALPKVSVNTGAVAGAGTIGLLISIFLFGPLEVGCRSFFRKNLYKEEELDELKTGFTPKYWRNVGTQLLTSLFIALWTLLLIIPGIVMSYAYAMVPYILAEDNDIQPMDAIRMSKDMMKGHKWELFVLDLSFIGWAILSVLTLGILNIFYVGPYYYSTHAAFYEDLKGRVALDA